MQSPAFVHVNVPWSRLPDCLIGQKLFVDIEAPRLSAQPKPPPPNNGFQFSKALKGAKGQGGSSCDQRGDGKFSDGTSIKKDGNYVYLGPDALSSSNAEATLNTLDKMASMGKKDVVRSSQQPPQGGTTEPDIMAIQKIVEHASNQRRPAAVSYQSMHDAAKGVLFDLDDTICSQPQNVRSPHGMMEPLPEPEYTLDCLEDSEPSRYEVRMHLPGIGSASEAHVDISKTELKVDVRDKYRLWIKLELPVDDLISKAKWNKSRNELLITLPLKHDHGLLEG